jgi:predicted nucleic acid-binding Zn ribbon protein
MYCAACGTPLAPGLSYCNRCGMSLKERGERRQTGAITAFLAAITVIAIAGLGIMLGGAFSLTSDLKDELVGFFMLFTFLIIAISEILLVRQLSRLTGAAAKAIDTSQSTALPNEIRGQLPRPLGEPVSSVTENTTRTLQYSRNEP